ncbi:hypothetical protein C8R47DRAFT_1084307 [Mycena vitilis]|nr:hypothetical protein C8R47DRAFT_1084307 [Mycena vitilis]
MKTSSASETGGGVAGHTARGLLLGLAELDGRARLLGEFGCWLGPFRFRVKGWEGVASSSSGPPGSGRHECGTLDQGGARWGRRRGGDSGTVFAAKEASEGEALGGGWRESAPGTETGWRSALLYHCLLNLQQTPCYLNRAPAKPMALLQKLRTVLDLHTR